MSDLKASKIERSDAYLESSLRGLLWEARADTGQLTTFAGELRGIFDSSAAELAHPRFTADLFHPDDRLRVQDLLARVRASGEAASFDARIKVPSKDPIWLRTAVRTVQHESGLYLRGVSFDITDLKQAQTEFTLARRRLTFLAGASRMLGESLDYQRTLENVAKSAVPEIADWCAVRILAPDGSMERVADVHSDPSREAMLKEMEERFPPTEEFGLRKVIREGKAEFLPDTTGLAEVVGTSDEHRALLHRIGFTSYICVPMRGREHPIGLISMAIIDSGRRFTEADLELAEVLAARATVAIENARLYRDARDELRRRETFIAQLGHELRNPLSAIANAIMVLDTEPAASERVVKLRDILVRQTSQLSRLVDDLLDIARISQGKIALNRTRLDLGELVTRCVQTLKETDGAAERRIELEIGDPDAIIDADEVRIEQVVWNLLTNATRFTEPDGRIEVVVSREENNALIVVSDDGAGIAAEELSNIFRPFHQAVIGDANAGGMGLGLALIDQMTRLHGGSVSVSSAGPAMGSRFEVRLPLAAPDAAAAEEDRADADAGEKRRVLIVDDNADALESLKMLLEYVGHEIEVASDGRSGTERVLSWHPEVALIDIGLPDIDGYEVVKRLRAMNLETPPLLVALTGYGQPEDRRRALAAGFDLHLTKPVDVDELNRILNWKGPHQA